MPALSLTDWQGWLEGLRPEDIELGLTRIRQVAARLGLDHLPGQVITVAGTNGKGSVIRLMDRLARKSGLTTGVYTSPHLFRFNERICQNGQEVSDAGLCEALAAVEAARQDVSLTYFEFTTLAAFWLFKHQPADLYLLEVGLGGRLDAVNLLDTDIAVITSIGLDHTRWLGNTRDAIGFEKAGIARYGRPLIYGEVDMPASIATQASERGADLLRAGRDFGVDQTSGECFWHQHVLMPPAKIPLGQDNLMTALEALACAGIIPATSMITEVAAGTCLAGRGEIYQLDGHDWLFDVGHNREAMERLSQCLSQRLSTGGTSGGRTLALFGMLADKPAAAVTALTGHVDAWFVADLPGPRGGNKERFRELLPEAQFFDALAHALTALGNALQPGDRVVVTGSFVTVATVQELLGLSKPARRAG